METRLRILTVAEKMFLQRGFARISMDELAASLGMSKKTLYRHFAGKQELLTALLKRRTETVGAEILEVIDSRISLPEKFRNLLHLIQRRMEETRPAFLEDLERHAPEQFRIIEEFRARMLPVYFDRILDEGVAAGLIRGDLNRSLFIRVIVDLIQVVARPSLLTEMRLHPWEGIDAILQIFFEGILTPAGRRAGDGTSCS